MGVRYNSKKFENHKITLNCLWILKKKTDKDGKVHTYKARLVAKGFKQTHGIDYDETFSPVTMLKSIEFLLPLLHIMIMRFGKWMLKLRFLMETYLRMCT